MKCTCHLLEDNFLRHTLLLNPHRTVFLPIFIPRALTFDLLWLLLNFFNLPFFRGLTLQSSKLMITTKGHLLLIKYSLLEIFCSPEMKASLTSMSWLFHCCFIFVLIFCLTKILKNDHQNCVPYFVPPKELPKQYFGSCTSIDLRAVLFCKSKEHIIRVIKEVRYGIGKSKPNSGLYLQVMEIQFPW